MRTTTAFTEACWFLSAYLEMQHPRYTTQDVLAGIARLEAIIGTGDAPKARWYIDRARCRLQGIHHQDNAW